MVTSTSTAPDLRTLLTTTQSAAQHTTADLHHKKTSDNTKQEKVDAKSRLFSFKKPNTPFTRIPTLPRCPVVRPKPASYCTQMQHLGSAGKMNYLQRVSKTREETESAVSTLVQLNQAIAQADEDIRESENAINDLLQSEEKEKERSEQD